MTFDEVIMAKALLLAKRAALNGEVPVGAVIVQTVDYIKDKGRLNQKDISKRIISCGINRREETNNSLKHAEIEAINKACKRLKRWRLFDCDIYVTLEPCPMCAGAIINSRINRVIFGANDYKSGACGSVINLFEQEFNHKPYVYSGIYEEECKSELRNFFEKLRKNR